MVVMEQPIELVEEVVVQQVQEHQEVQVIFLEVLVVQV